MEPIDDGTVHESRELSGSDSEISSRREAKSHMQVLLYLINEVGPAVLSGIRDSVSLYLGPH